MNALMKLIRWPNLLMVIFTLYLVRHAVIPAFETPNPPEGLNELYYALMVISTTLVAAAGYIINDIRDLEIDKINRPRRYILQRKISVEKARIYYYAMNSASALLISIVCIVNGTYSLIIIHLASMFFLWLYSTELKCQPLIGNIIVSLLTACIPMLGLFYYVFPSEGFHFNDLPNTLLHIILMYTVFSFLISLVREMFKDLEDREGDRKKGCRTVAIAWKCLNIKRLSYLAVAFAFAAMVYLIRELLDTPHYLFGASLVSIIVVLFFELLPQIFKAKKKKDFRRVSFTSKVLLAGGLLLLFLLKF